MIKKFLLSCTIQYHMTYYLNLGHSHFTCIIYFCSFFYCDKRFHNQKIKDFTIRKTICPHMFYTFSTVTYGDTFTIFTCPSSLLIGYFSSGTKFLISRYIRANLSLPVLSSLKIFCFHMYHHTYHFGRSRSHSH